MNENQNMNQNGNMNQNSDMNPNGNMNQNMGGFNNPSMPNGSPAGTNNGQVNSEVESGKLMAILSYIGILCLIPYFAEKNNSFVVFHAKQGLNLFILEIIALVAANILGGIMYMTYTLTSIVEIAVLIFSIIGIVYAAQGEKKELPVIGSIKIVK